MTLELDTTEQGATRVLNRVEPRRNTTRTWGPSVLTITIVVLATGGLVAGLYPMTASWLSSYNQSRVIVDYQHDLERVDPTPSQQIALARQYNDALTAGVVLEANGNVPVSSGTLTDGSLEYGQILSANAAGLMGRVKIAKIGVDLPVYHGTSEAVLTRGAGHLQGSHFPVGGEGTHSVITAHRGLANATMFSNLDDVTVGDTFTIETFGEVLTYRVRDTQVIEPRDTDHIRAVAGEDLVTLITCTPLGVNTHRILVTGERITPTPLNDIQAAGENPTVPGFPWWSVLGAAGLALITAYLVRQGFTDSTARARNVAPRTTPVMTPETGGREPASDSQERNHAETIDAQ